MPRVSRWMLRVGLLHLVAALALAGAEAAAWSGWLSPAWLAVRPAWIHLLVVGWATQLIFGVSHWMFPRFSRERPRGYEGLVWAAFGMLNAGLVARVASEPLAALHPGSGWAVLLFAGGLLQWAALLALAAHTWPRVRARGR